MNEERREDAEEPLRIVPPEREGRQQHERARPLDVVAAVAADGRDPRRPAAVPRALPVKERHEHLEGRAGLLVAAAPPHGEQRVEGPLRAARVEPEPGERRVALGRPVAPQHREEDRRAIVPLLEVPQQREQHVVRRLRRWILSVPVEPQERALTLLAVLLVVAEEGEERAALLVLGRVGEREEERVLRVLVVPEEVQREDPGERAVGAARAHGERRHDREHVAAHVVLEAPEERRDDVRLGLRRPRVPVERREDRVAGRRALRPVQARDLAERALAVIEVEDVRRRLDRLAGPLLADRLVRAVVVARARLADRRHRGRGGRADAGRAARRRRRAPGRARRAPRARPRAGTDRTTRWPRPTPTGRADGAEEDDEASEASAESRGQGVRHSEVHAR